MRGDFLAVGYVFKVPGGGRNRGNTEDSDDGRKEGRKHDKCMVG